MITLKVKRLCPEAKLPTQAHSTDAGLDIYATSRVFDKDGNATYGTGIAVEIPDGHVGLLFPRSSIAERHLTLSNSVGVIDSGYRGEIKFKFKPSLVFIEDHDCHAMPPRVYEVGERIGQLIVIPIPYVAVVESTDLSESERGEGGYGSTGQK